MVAGFVRVIINDDKNEDVIDILVLKDKLWLSFFMIPMPIDVYKRQLYEYLKNSDEKILEIIMLKIQGYSIREISKITGLTTNQIYKRIKKLKKVL